ncbi:MAG: dihydroneopterin aldolase [Clostridiaceae bacterium]|nr:dihydroneopterin aldolase [Clostridiaceae bacterium]
MGKIIIKNMKVHGYHGVNPLEKEKGQVFCFDIEMHASLDKAGYSDNIDDTVDYSRVYGLVKHIVQNERFQLMEKLAKTIARAILREYDMVKAVKVVAKKPEAPIDGEFDWVGVEINLEREDAGE